MADITINLVVSTVANRISKVLIEEYAVLGGAARHVQWIERELRSMQGLLEQVEQRRYGEQEQELNAWADKLMEIARDAEDVIETFVIRSVKRRRGGILYWFDKYKVGKELGQIRKRMRDISQERMTLVAVSVETPGEASTTTTVVAPAMEKLDHILSENLVTDDEVMEIVEQVKGELGDLQNIVSNLKSTSERDKVWLEEVKDICSYTLDVAGNFIARKQKWLKMDRLRKVLYFYEGYASAWELEKQMKYIRTQTGDALHRKFTYGIGGEHMGGVGEGDKQTTQRSTPVPNLSLESLIIVSLTFSIIYAALFFIPFASSWPTTLLFLIIFDAFEYAAGKQGKTEPKLESNQQKKKKGGKGRAMLPILLFYILVDVVIIILSQFLPLQATFFLNLISPLYEVIVWNVISWKSMDRNLKCAQRSLALMCAFLSDTGSAEGLNKRQKVWVGQLRLVAQNGRSLVAAAASPPNDCLSRIKFAKEINGLLKEIIYISDRKSIYGIANIEGRREIVIVSSGPSTQEGEIIAEQDTHNSGSGGTGEVEQLASTYRHVTGLKEKVQSIREERELMDALFKDVQDMGEIDGRLRIWVEQMRGIAREVEYVINEYDAKLEGKPIPIYILKYKTRRVINKKINEIRNKIEDASRRRKIYGLVLVQFQSRAESLSTVQILRGRTQPSLIDKESSVVGFDDDVQVLKAQLLSDEKHRCITCIVGIGGTGKTTLARLIFDDKAIVDHFECPIWLSVPSNYMPQLLLEEIAKEAAKKITGIGGLNLHDVLENLANKMYIIIVDGIETSQVLDTLNNAIPDRSTASRILLTTRNANVAEHVGTTRTFVHPLQLLDDESSWALFTRYLKVHIPPELVKLGREIVIKCGGLPSEILKTGDLLSTKDVTHEEWSSVLGKLNQDQKSWSETLDIINMNIPNYLRRCLFYFVLFPAEFGIPVRRLVVLWVAESLVHHAEEDEPPEQVAERYLTELIDRNTVQIAKRKRNGKVKTCRLPNALRQLWLRKANESRFLQGYTATDLNADPKKTIIRRVADHLKKDDIWHNHIHGDTTYDSASLSTYYKDVLSFLSFDTQEGSKPGQQIGNFLKGCISSDCFLLLRVLDLERVYKPRLLKSIARLSRLRYLGLRWTYLESLPSSISSLLKLQTLDLKHTYIHTLPSSIWNMELRHLFLSETFRTRFPPQPKGNSLSDLQTLWGLFVDEETPVKDGLDILVNIRKLGLACQSMSLQPEAMKEQLEAVVDWIMKLEHLQSLRLKSRDEEGRPWILPLKSFENNINLTDMYLLGSLSSSSVLSQFPLGLIELTLSHSKLQDDPMQILKDFPNLRTLCLLAESYVGKTMVCESKSFPWLQVLKFWVLEQLEEWKIEEGALPSLRQLEIRSCLCLKMLPDGLEHVNTLLELKLTNMPTEINADMHNIPPNCQVVQHYFQ